MHPLCCACGVVLLASLQNCVSPNIFNVVVIVFINIIDDDDKIEGDIAAASAVNRKNSHYATPGYCKKWVGRFFFNENSP